jgi:hyperosmotically inducible periplasmic protein
MKKALTTFTLAVMLGSSLLITGCTTEQRGGRSAGEYIDDKTLNARVKGALNDNPEYKFDDVKVESFKGTVQLSGFVTTADQKAKAGDIAKRVPGVQNVDNKITVKSA